MKGEPLKFFRVRIEVYPAIAPLREYDNEMHDFDKAEIADKPVIAKSINVRELYEDTYLNNLIKAEMYDIGMRQLYA